MKPLRISKIFNETKKPVSARLPIMESMTGHGRGIAYADGIRAVVECSSVNRKSAEVIFIASREYAAIEPYVREEILNRISRGRVTANIAVTVDESKISHINITVAKTYYKELKKLQKELGIVGEIPLKLILAGPCVRNDVLRKPDDLWPVIKKALDASLKSLLAMRSKEGRNLLTALKREILNIGRATAGIKHHATRLTERHRQALEGRLVNAGLRCKISDPQVAAEIALFAERCDITEELDRIESHREQFLEKLNEKGPIGRTLEFILQEMIREWNTVGSKANDVSVSRFVIEAKTALDRLREQLANIE